MLACAYSERPPKFPDFAPYPARTPFNAVMGPLHARMEADGAITIGLWVQETHMNHRQSMHGGMVTSLADTAMGNHAARAANGSVVTVHLSADYLSTVPLGSWLEVRSRLDRKGKRMLFVACTGTIDGELVFRGSGVFSAVQPKAAATPGG